MKIKVTKNEHYGVAEALINSIVVTLPILVTMGVHLSLFCVICNLIPHNSVLKQLQEENL